MDKTNHSLPCLQVHFVLSPKGILLRQSGKFPNRPADVRGRQKGSVSVEAALVLPIFIICIPGLLSVLNYLRVYGSILSELKAMGEPLTVYGYALELTQEEADSTEDSGILEYLIQSLVFSEGYLSTAFQLQWEDAVGQDTVVNGVSGVSFLGSVLDTDEKEIYIQAHYQVQALLPFNALQCDMSNYYYSKLWTGYEEEASSEEMVYVTAGSEVYHLTDSCSYLRLTVKTISAAQLDSARNSSGSRYHSCSLCGSNTAIGGIYYVTSSGDCYHTSSECSGLKRTVYQIPLSQVGDKRPCSRCGKET
ncbi:MAG: pilus assembly protein [Lachnospiraceae bacterium]|nr:pilus assembly protein [Lachnospiraceae bacterium]